MQRHLPPCVLVLVALVGVGSAAAGLAVSASAAGSSVRPTIVEVDGDRDNGFGVHYADGSSIFPPTDSEARAECGEYDTRVARVRCRTEVMTWYRDLGDLQRSLAYVRAHG